MKKAFLIFVVLFMLACNGVGITPAPIQTDSQGDETPTSISYPSEAPGEVTATAPIPSTSSSGEIVPIPASSVQIEGVSYQAYQISGDPFRFVCQEPCPLDQQYIYAEYAGFRLAHAQLIKLTGVDTLAELQPVDMHLVFEDSICRDLPAGHAFIYSGTHQAYTCTDGPGYYPTMEEKIQKAAQPDAQYFPLHEYMHTIFFGRIYGQAGSFQHAKAWFFHDYVVQLPSYAIGILDPAGFCTYQELAPGDFNGRLIYELCQQNGFQLADLAPSLIELDKLYQSGGGEIDQEGFEHPVPSVAQYRDILNRLLGSDTTPAFAAACWPPELFGNSYSLSGACSPQAIGTPTPLK